METKSSEGAYGEGQMPPMRGGRERITFMLEMSRLSEVGRGAPEEQMTAYQGGNSNQEDTYCQKCHRTEKVRNQRKQY